MAATPPICDFGWKAVDFHLPATDGRAYSLADIRGPKGTLIAFICNHCPYVKAVIGRLVRDAKELKGATVYIKVAFRDALSLDANDPTALNNLSWLLAFQPQKHAEALRLVQHAIKTIGPLAGPDSIDRGTAV